MEKLPSHKISKLTYITRQLIFLIVLLEVIKALESAGAKVRVERQPEHTDGGDSALVIELDDNLVELVVHERRTNLYPTDVAKLARALPHEAGRDPILVAPFVGPRLGDTLIEAGWSWADAAGNFDVKAPGIRLRQRLVLHRPPRQQRVLPRGVGSTAIIRWLLTHAPTGERIDPAVLTEVGQVSQPRVSQILQTLARQDLLTREGRTYKLEAIEPLLEAFLRDYPGPKGSERFAYSLDASGPFAAKATEILGSTLASSTFAISADVGPDLLSPWRRPSHTIIYLRQNVALDDLGLVDAHGRDDANVSLRMPDDTSLFTTIIHRTFDSTEIPLVDVPQMMWDLLDLGGEDREEAAGRLREWFIQHRKTS